MLGDLLLRSCRPSAARETGVADPRTEDDELDFGWHSRGRFGGRLGAPVLEEHDNPPRLGWGMRAHGPAQAEPQPKPQEPEDEPASDAPPSDEPEPALAPPLTRMWPE